MSKTPRKRNNDSKGLSPVKPVQSQADFDEVLGLIDAARTKAFATVNTVLIDLYWNIGAYIHRKIEADGWGRGTVEALAEFIRQRQPNAKGFSSQNLWRMRQFVETYRREPKLAPLVRELPWTHNLMILSRRKREEEREFYLRVCLKEQWGKRELERQMNSALFERIVYNLVWVESRAQDYAAALTRVAEALALDQRGEYRERLLHKQQEVLGLLARQQQQDYLKLVNLVSRYAPPQEAAKPEVGAPLADATRPLAVNDIPIAREGERS